MVTCINVEKIETSMGGGHMCTGPCGQPHLHGKPWSWWLCLPCRRHAATTALRAAERDRLAIYYPPPETGPKQASVQRAEQRRRKKEQQ